MPSPVGDPSRHRAYVDTELVSDIVRELEAWRVVVLVGPLGFGKTTVAGCVGERLVQHDCTAETLRLIDDIDKASPTQLHEAFAFVHAGGRVLATAEPSAHHILNRLIAEHGARRFDLPGLSRSTARDMITQRFHPDLVSEETIEMILDRADGNPLLLSELLRVLPSDGMTNRRGVWTWDVPTPPLRSIGTLLASRLADLSADELAALRFVALEAPVRLDLCEAIWQKRPIDGLRSQGLIGVHRVSGSPFVRVIDPLYREAALATLDQPSTAAINARSLDRITAPDAFGDSTWLRVLRWTLGNDQTPSQDLLTKAQDAAARQRDRAPVLLVADAVARYGDTDQRRLAGRVERAKWLLHTSQFDECAREIAAAEAEMHHGNADPLVAIRLVQAKCDLVAMTSPQESLNPLHALEADHSDGSASIAVQQSTAAGAMNLHGALSSGSLAFAQLLDIDDDGVQTSMIAGYGLAATLAGRESDARQRLKRLLSKAHAPGTLDPARADGIMAALIAMDIVSGRCDEARTLIADLRSRRDTETARVAMRPLDLLDALHAASEARWSEADRSARVAAAHYETTDTFGLMRLSLATLALAQAAMDGHAGARKTRTDLWHRQRVFGIGEPIVQIQLALTSVWLREPNAAAIALEAAEECRRHESPLGELRTLHVATLADAELLDELLPDIRSLAARVDAPVAPSILAHCEARLDNDRARAEDAIRELARMGVPLPVPSAFAPLSLREREVTTLAALGYSSKAIAARLVVSPRTVETYLTRAFSKLGIASRDDLPRFLGYRQD